MGKISSLFLSDEEMGKKDDDHRADRRSAHARRGLAAWAPARIQPVQPRRVLKRLLILAVVGLLVYEFIANIPTDVPIRDRRHPQYRHAKSSRPPHAAEPVAVVQPKDSASPPNSKTPGVASDGRAHKDTVSSPTVAGEPAHDYKGPIKFPELDTTLQAIGETRGAYQLNKNVLFAAASLRSAATLLPLACQMGSELRSYVHFALMSRSGIAIEELQKVNGIDESCHIIFHDARPRFASVSTDTRLEDSVSKALRRINTYMHPQAVIVDSPSHEEHYFTQGMRRQTRALRVSFIELPARRPEKLSWMTKLDSQALKAWNMINVDILIHAASGGSGSLIRLLKSLASADYFSSLTPHVTIELPHTVDTATQLFLQKFEWPPARLQDGVYPSQLSIRHRIPRKGLDQEESSIRFLESFWPAKPQHSHVLVLSPNAELSPNFFHYLKYTVLAYRYSIPAQVQQWGDRLLGISLELPSTFLNGSGPFEPPRKAESIESGPSPPDSPSSFLWEAPTSNAMLVLGDKWMELHGFISKLFAAQHAATETPRVLAEKLVSKKHPAWLEQALRLCRARGYLTLYPSEPASSQLATVHTDLYRPPEEYADDQPEESGRQDADSGNGETANARGPLLDTLPEGGALLPFYELPLLSWDGIPTEIASFEDGAQKYAREFRRTAGGCAKDDSGSLKADWLAADLFCQA